MAGAMGRRPRLSSAHPGGNVAPAQPAPAQRRAGLHCPAGPEARAPAHHSVTGATLPPGTASWADRAIDLSKRFGAFPGGGSGQRAHRAAARIFGFLGFQRAVGKKQDDEDAWRVLCWPASSGQGASVHQAPGDAGDLTTRPRLGTCRQGVLACISGADGLCRQETLVAAMARLFRLPEAGDSPGVWLAKLQQQFGLGGLEGALARLPLPLGVCGSGCFPGGGGAGAPARKLFDSLMTPTSGSIRSPGNTSLAES